MATAEDLSWLSRNDPRSPEYLRRYLEAFPEQHVLVEVANALLAAAKGQPALVRIMRALLRRAYDEVIDMSRTGRWSIAQLEKTEKTYIGTKVEILVRHELDLPKGIVLDLHVAGHEVDIKNTLGDNWTIPQEAINQICMLIKGNEVSRLFSVGLLHASPENLTVGQNRDRKVAVSAAGRNTILWLVSAGRLPENFFLSLSDADRTAILSPRSGAARVRELFRRIRGRIIHRDVVIGVAQQKDAMKRVRGNGGARDALADEGIWVFSGKYDARAVSAFGGPALARDDFIAFSRDEIELLSAGGTP